jgi:4-alpha-glucanotransferase
MPSNHGIVVPLFSLHTKNSSGIGEFLDLIPLIDWCASVGLNVIQLLPLNDTGGEPSPYYTISSCALDPKYLSLPSPFFGDKLEHLFSRFKASPHTTFKAPWLETYARFKAEKDPRFPPEFHKYLQGLCFDQMKQVRAHATKQNVCLLGDIPILVSPDSADVHAASHLFDLTLEAGAPPDQYNAEGQHWGFPLLRWEAPGQKAWWKQRMQTAAECYHACRIDHVVGYFRIWAIEAGKLPVEGHFVPENPEVWRELGRERLRHIVQATDMIPIAEDLGTVPEWVAGVLKELGICSTKVFLWQPPGVDYEPLSLTTVSTPDTEPLGLMWEKLPDLVQPYVEWKGWSYEPELKAWQRKELLRDAHHTTSMWHVNLLQETLALFPELVHEDVHEERINVPGTVLPTNWTYKFKPSVEELMAHEGLQKAFAEIIGMTQQLSGTFTATNSEVPGIGDA